MEGPSRNRFGGAPPPTQYPPTNGGGLDAVGQLAKRILMGASGGGQAGMNENWGAAMSGGTGYNPQLGGGGIPPQMPQMPGALGQQGAANPLAQLVQQMALRGGRGSGGGGASFGGGIPPGRPQIYEDGSMSNPFAGNTIAQSPYQAQGQPRSPQLDEQTRAGILALLMQLQAGKQGRQRRQMSQRLTPWG